MQLDFTRMRIKTPFAFGAMLVGLNRLGLLITQYIAVDNSRNVFAT